jgi:hypothetical protein
MIGTAIAAISAAVITAAINPGQADNRLGEQQGCDSDRGVDGIAGGVIASDTACEGQGEKQEKNPFNHSTSYTISRGD